jgi:hypothetical protein
MSTESLPDLTFPMVEYGRTAMPWDLRPLLYRGGATVDTRKVFNLMAAGTLGSPLPERLGLVIEIHQALTGNLVSGLSKHNQIRLNGVLAQLAATPSNTPRLRALEQEKRGLENYFAYISRS